MCQNCEKQGKSAAFVFFSDLCNVIRNKAENREKYEQYYNVLVLYDEIVLIEPETEGHSEYVEYWMNSLCSDFDSFDIKVSFLPRVSLSKMVSMFEDWGGIFKQKMEDFVNGK